MKYKITIRTGDKSGAGTDSNISIQLFGSKSATNKLILDSKLSQFEKGDSDKFYANSADLGNLQKIKIGNDNKFFGSKWYLEEVIIEPASDIKKWYFPVFKWIDDKIITVKSKIGSRYLVEISAGTFPGSGSDNEINISIVGSKTYTNFTEISKYFKNGKLKTGHTEVFSFVSEDVGKIQQINIKSTSSLLSTNWFLSKIRIKKETDSMYKSFPYHNWIEHSKNYSSTANLTEYTLKIFTGDVASGGTDANVTIIITGSKGATKPIHLNELIARNAFESGNIDYLKFASKNLGEIKKIKIWHDEKWLGDGWFLNKISIKNEKNGEEFIFPFYSWLDKSADPKSTTIELTRKPLSVRPFYAIAHMVNTPIYAEEALDLGSNAIEFDITPQTDKNGDFVFDVFHGFRPDFDPDKINLMERSIARTPINIFLEGLRILENKFQSFTLVIYDCKLDKIRKNQLKLCGEQLAEKVIHNFYGENYKNRIFTIFSVGKKRSEPFFDGINSAIPSGLKPYIGFDLSMESFQTTEKVFTNRTESNFWWGSGIASTVPKPLKHFIPQFLIAAKKRAKRSIIKKIYYWTLDDPDSMARILVTKLDGIIVNDPLKLLKVLEKEEFRHTYRLANREDNPFEVS